MRRQMTYTSSVFLARILLPAILIGASTVAALEVGEQAPDFTLPSTMGEKVSLSQFRGKKLVLVEFFIAAASRTGT